MERRYLKWFIAVLIIGIVVGLVLNIYYDFKARQDTTGLLKELFALARAGEAEKFVTRSHIMDAYIFGDLDAAELSARENGLSELYAEIVSGNLSVQSVSFVKIVERLAALVRIKATDSKGAQQELHLILIKEKNRQNEDRWLPYRLPHPEERRKEVVSRAKKLLDADAIRENVRKSVLSAVSSVEAGREAAFASVENFLKSPDEIMAQVKEQAQALAPLIPDEVVRKSFEKTLENGEGDLPSALKSLLTPQAKLRNLIARLKAVSDAQPEEAQATAERLAANAAQLPNRVGSLLGTIGFCLRPAQQRHSEVANRIGSLVSQFAPEDWRSALEERLEEAAGKPEVDLKPLFAQAKEAASSPTQILQEKVQAVAVIVRKRSIPPEAKEEFLKRLDDLEQDSDFGGVAEELAAIVTTEEAIRFSFLSALSGPAGYASEVIALQSTRDYLEEIMKAAKYEASITTSSILVALEFDSSAPADIYAELVSEVRDATSKVKDCAVIPERNLRKHTEEQVRRMPDKWSEMKTEEEFLNWAFPEGIPENRALVDEARKFFDSIKGKKIEIANVHQWYDRYRTSALVIVRVLLDSDKYGKAVEEKYEGAKGRYEEVKKGCQEARKEYKEAQERHKKGEKEYEEAKEKYEQMQKEHKEAKQNYEEAEETYRDALEKREYAVLCLILVQKMSRDWSVAWTLARASSVHNEDYKKAVIGIYEEEMKRREEILSSQ